MRHTLVPRCLARGSTKNRKRCSMACSVFISNLDGKDGDILFSMGT
jgi:hypothetical protein